MNWDNLRVFLALSRAGSVAAAARVLSVSRSTVNRRLDTLEGGRAALFIRTEDGLLLTDAGSELVPIAERLEQEAFAAERLLGGQDFRLEGRLELTVFDAIEGLFAPVLADFAALHPSIDLRVRTSNQVASLRRRETDVAIRATQTPGQSLFGRAIATMPYAVFGNAQQLGCDNPPWVLWDEGMGAEGTWALARKRARPLHIAAQVDSFGLMLGLTRAGVGVSLLPMAVAQRFPELHLLGEAPCKGLDQRVWLLTHPDLRRSARVRAAMDFFGAHLPQRLAASWVPKG